MNWQQQTIDLFLAYESIAVVISIVLNIVISVLGVVPSVFLTAANLAVFGLWGGIGVSFIGEVIGALIAFFLYRKGFGQLKDRKGFPNPKVQRLLVASGKDSFLLILSLRIMPFVPSGLVTFIAAIGKTPWPIFAAASSLGKIPAILIEGFSVYQVIQWTGMGKWILASLAGIFIFLTLRRLYSRPSS
ncbi:VTT domain-containing protein [Rossellomorea marisflavi]|uniref:TVP38/TMEM64 family membrane protein n=1 Tax=Rossellomorea marisflavi TaxID=189381 RepID=A0A5D4RP06_9BACI|nr:VTT domain-containing protein [Rossellomorea marisflavi]TYS51498.1 VTT domain-containing protein [Rossellomorea marisflavi]WJV19041.1 VTT domain-containing protein [Rossellomorea marisflavi]